MIQDQEDFAPILDIDQNIELEYWKKSKGYSYNPTFANSFTGERSFFKLR